MAEVEERDGEQDGGVGGDKEEHSATHVLRKRVVGFTDATIAF
jgi:hypothetical protein